ARLDRYGYLTASIPANVPASDPAHGKVPPIGFLAHVDTSPDVSGAGVKPQVLVYPGGDIRLPGDPSVVIRAAENPALRDNIGKTIITSDGTTLLGADDKAGVAVIMSLVERLRADPAVLHGDVKIAFTPDEEVSAGTKFFDVGAFGARYAYTVDGEVLGTLNKETFSADSAVVTVTGRDIHPGMAKDVMVNAVRVAAEIVARTPRDMAPETTEGRQPYMHPHAIEGGVGQAVVKLLFRDFKTEDLQALKSRLEAVAAEVRALYPKARIAIEVKESYRNMRPALERNPEVLEALSRAVERAGVAPRWEPIRGGTDGARLTERGLPTPNIWTGGCNAHGQTEWASLHAMEKSLETVVNLAQVWVERSQTS
ncbi:MAG: peptidase T, partial [Elusimicrobia bacterium]|nr:peptidase T [Elusimicrobiota bacterium]